MFADTMLDLFDHIMTNYLNYGYDEGEDSYYFKELTQIFKLIWIIIDKGNDNYDPSKDHVYEKMAIMTFLRIDCKKRICFCKDHDWCNICSKFNVCLYQLKLEDELESI